ncbi:MAG: tetratricopeptide repeat protein [Chloroflexi bacterium]|nr:tetratricopeptide repeat protein [Chloroflexota bacterium]
MEPQKSFDELLKEGTELFDAKKYDEALAVFLSAVQLNGNSPVAFYDVGITNSYLGNYSEAEKWYEKAVQASEHYPDAYNSWGVALENQGEYARAIEKYKKALEQDSQYVFAYSNLARLLLDKLDKPDEAVRVCEEALKKLTDEKDKVKFHVQMGHALRKKGLDREAAEHYDAAVAVDEAHLSVYQDWGAELMRKPGKLEEAVGKYQRLIAAAKDKAQKAEAYKKLGDACREEGYYDEAIKAYESALAENAEDTEPLLLLGHCYNNLRNYPQAETYYNQFIEKNKDKQDDWNLATAYGQLGWVFYYRNEYDKALENFALAEEKYKPYGWGYMGSARAGQDRGEYDLALADIQKAVELRPDAYNFRIEFGYQYEFIGEYEKALEQYRLAADNLPDVPAPFFRLGYVLNILKRYDDAIAEYERAQTKKPDTVLDFDPLFATHNIADLLNLQGRYRQAKRKWRETYERYLAAEPIAARQRYPDIYQYAGAISWEFFQMFDEKEKTFKCELLFKQGLTYDPEHIGLLLALLEFYMEIRKLLEYGGAKQNSRNKWLAQVIAILETGDDSTLVRKSIDVNWQGMQVFQTLIRILDKRLETVETQKLNTKIKAQYHLNRAKAYLAIERHADAKKDAEKAVACDDRYAEAYSTLGVVCMRLEDYKSAMQNFRLAIENDTDNLAYLSNLAEAYLKAEMLDEARKQYETVLKISPFHLDSIIGLAETFAALGDVPKEGKRFEDAEEMYTQAIECYTRALSLADSDDASKVLKPQEVAAIRYARGYARVMLFESQTHRDERILRDARRDFESIPPTDKNYQKAKRSAKKITEKLRPFSPSNLEQRAGGWVIMIAFIAFLVGQFMFFLGQPVRVPPGYRLTEAGVDALQAAGVPDELLLGIEALVAERFDSQKDLLDTVSALFGDAMTLDTHRTVVANIEPVPASMDYQQVDVGFYALFTFGPLIFFVAGAYLQQISRLKFAGIEIEKSSVDQISTSGSLGVSK